MSSSLYEIPVVKIDGAVSTLGEYAGKALLIVNVASECGYTFHYEGLEAIWKKYRDQGLVVVGFPSNDFGGQEPGSDEQIQEFCSTKFGVTFPLYSKIVVTGEDKHPLYAALVAAKPEAVIHEDSPLIKNLLAGNWIQEVKPAEILWNFEKFLISPEGEVVERFAADVKPEDELITAVVEAHLPGAVTA